MSNNKKNIYLVRHGQSTSNAGGIAVRNSEIPITNLGEQQSHEAANWLLDNVSPIKDVFISKFIRTAQTAEPLVQATKIQPTVVEGLQEFNYISFANIDGIEATKRNQLASEYWLTADSDFIDGDIDSDAENFNQLNKRLTTVLDYFDNLPDGNYIAYTHGMWLAALMWRLLGFATSDNAEMQRFRQFEQALKIHNTEVFLLQMQADKHSAITKVREIKP